MRKFIKYIVLILLILVTAFYSSSLLNGNRSVDKKDRAYQNSYQHLEEITKENHPSDSSGIQAVRNYILLQLQDIGASYQVLEDGYKVSDWIEQMVEQYEAGSKERKSQDEAEAASYGFDTFREYITDVAVFMYGGLEAEINMKNILVKVEGTGDKGIMLIAHYDTSYESYGAGDDGAAVAGMLEAVRTALEQNNSNDLYFLFTEGEEKRLWGSHAFVREHPEYLDNVKAVFNLEGRGSDGTPILFETSRNNSGLIKETGKALRYITGYSFISDIYRYMPNCSDLNEFMDAGYAGVNFAFSGLEENNHLPSDNLENLSDKTLYDMVSLQQELVKYYSESDLTKLTSNSDAVYFPILRGHLFIVPNSINQVFSLLALAAVIAVVILYLLQKKVMLKKLVKCLLSLPVFLICVFGIIFIIGLPATGTYLKLLNRTWGDSPDYAGFAAAGRLNYIFFWLLLSITVILSFLFTKYIGVKKGARKELSAACLILEAVALTGLMLALNSISYLLAVPAFITAVTQLTVWFSGGKSQKFIRRIAAYINMAVTIFVLLPFVEAVYRGLRITYILWITPCLSAFIVIPVILSLIWLKEDEKEVVVHY